MGSPNAEELSNDNRITRALQKFRASADDSLAVPMSSHEVGDVQRMGRPKAKELSDNNRMTRGFSSCSAGFRRSTSCSDVIPWGRRC